VHKVVSRQIEVYKLAKKESSDNYSIQPAFEFPILHDADDDVIALDIDTNGKYIMTCSTNKNDLVLCDLKGTLLSRLDTFQMTTYYANISPCGKYVAASGFTPDVKVWSVKFTKSGDLDKVARAFELTGHTSGVYHFAWRNDSARMATVSKDGTWRVYNVDVDHHIGQYTKLISSGKIDALPSSKVALSPDGRVLAISVGKNINVYSADPAKLLMVLTNVHTEPISGLLFDAEARWLISAGDKHIRVFHNVIGFQKSLVDFKKKLTDAKTEGHKERLTQQIDELKSKLKDIGQPEEHD
jgi:WD40 repeat protein